ncbi:DUF2213 domain-containing protein [Pantoea agglomerans]|uniref:DUF2213 domain-containing protein n=1 Tax=Enterobacter agglomerans TaxID=549 RepID=UPI00177E81EF|nr:DUF2213 domain-containing protein [Pantoea agglomerans]MBD8152247.1 cell envelope biogenesis protein TolA [Pantoea agglomerans]MBD8231425.1 cell envelope biogenesis protein TolA [Pantoea agglomerans]
MFLTELNAAERIRDGLLPSPYPFQNMSLVNLRITGTGLAYRSKHKEYVWRDPATFLNSQFLARCCGLPVILNHPDNEMLDGRESETRIVGTVMLPYIRGDEIWAICRIYGSGIVNLIQKGGVSTSPSVVFCRDSGCIDVPEGDENFLFEGTPFLLDHIALVPLGVWDKDGKPAGVDVTEQPEEVQIVGMVKAAMAVAIEPTLEKLSALSDRLDEIEKMSAA